MGVTKKVMGAGEFKAKCLQVISDVADQHRSVTITKRGKALAQLVPLDAVGINPPRAARPLIEYERDLVSPIDVVWDADS